MGIRVPSSQTLQTGSAPAALPNRLRVNTDAPAEAFGGGAASQSRVSNAMNQTLDIVKSESEKADSLAVLAAETELARKKQNMVFDPKTGLMTRKGKDAMPALQEFSKTFEDTSKELEGTLKTERQKLLFKQKASAQRDDFNGQLQKHAGQELARFSEEQSETRLVLAREDAATRFMEPDAIASSIETQKGVVVEQAVREGKSEEWVKLKTQEVGSKTNLSVLDRMVNSGNDQHAEDFFAQNKDSFSAGDLDKAKAILEEGTLLGKTQRESDAIMAKSLSMSAALDQARTIQDPKVRDRVTAEVRERFQLDKIAKEDARNNIFDASANIIEKNGGDVTQIPRSQWAAMSLQDRNAIDARAKQLKSGTEPVTDWGKYYEVKTLASNDSTRNDFLRTNLMTLRPNMAEAEFKELVNLQTQMRKGGNANELMGGFRTQMQVVQGTMKSIGIKTDGKPGTESAKKAEQFMRAVDEEVIAFQQQSGKKATSVDVQNIADKLVIEATIPNSRFFGFFDKKVRLYEVEEGQTAIVEAKDLNRSERLKIEGILREMGQPITENNIMSVFNMTLETTKGSGT